VDETDPPADHQAQVFGVELADRLAAQVIAP
jgi:hypothetical protein